MAHLEWPVNIRLSLRPVEDWVEVFERGKLPRERFQLVYDLADGPAAIDRVLCWWCRDYHPPNEVPACMALTRPVAAKGDGSTSSLTVNMPEWLSQFPEIWEFLSKPLYKDGTPRQLGKVTLSLESGGVRMSLTDPSSCTYCSRQHPSLADALLAFEVGLSDGSLTWRASGPPKGKKGR